MSDFEYREKAVKAFNESIFSIGCGIGADDQHSPNEWAIYTL